MLRRGKKTKEINLIKRFELFLINLIVPMCLLQVGHFLFAQHETFVECDSVLIETRNTHTHWMYITSIEYSIFQRVGENCLCNSHKSQYSFNVKSQKVMMAWAQTLLMENILIVGFRQILIVEYWITGQRNSILDMYNSIFFGLN